MSTIPIVLDGFEGAEWGVTIKPAAFTVVLDTKAPNVGVSAPLSVDFPGSATIFVGSDEPLGSLDVSYIDPGGLAWALGATLNDDRNFGVATLYTNDVGGGAGTLRVVAADLVGNVSTVTRGIVVNKPPQITLTSEIRAAFDLTIEMHQA